MELEYENFFKITLRAMRFNRTDPAIKRDSKWLIQFLLFHGLYSLMFILLIYNVIFINLKQNNFPAVCKNLLLACVYCVITFEYSIMIWKQRHLKILMDAMKTDYLQAKLLPLKEQKIIQDFALQGQHVCKQWVAISFIGTGLFPAKNIALIIFYWIVDGKIYMIPVYDLVYPSIVEDRKDEVWIYALQYLAVILYGLYSSVMYCAFVPIGPICMLHACGQLEIVRNRIHSLFDDDNLQKADQRLKEVVKQLQIIYEFVDRIKVSFRVAYEMTMKTTMIMLPVTSYEVIESLKHGELSLEFIVFIIGGVIFSSSPCFYSDLLMEKGEGVRQAMYFCGWEKVPSCGFRSTVRIVLQRALKPTGIRTLFETMTLEALTDLFQQAYKIFNLMNAVWG